MPYEISNAFKDIGKAIKFNLDNNLYGSTMILTLSAMDAMAFLAMPENKKEVHRSDFIGWIDKYMESNADQNYRYRAIDIYGARCGIVHRYSPTSRLSDSGDCKLFCYHNGSEHIYNPLVNHELVAISVKRFVNDFFKAVKRFLVDIRNDMELRRKVEHRLGNLFIITPV